MFAEFTFMFTASTRYEQLRPLFERTTDGLHQLHLRRAWVRFDPVARSAPPS